MEVKPVSKKSISEEIVDQIRAMIEQGELAIGDRLPAERRLAEMFSVSRTTVREAIKIMAESGVIESRQGSGTFVSEAGEQRSSLVDAILKGKPGMRDVLEVRKMMEPEIAALAAQNASPSDVNRLEAVLYEQEAAIQAGESGSGSDLRFHQLLAETSGNVVLREMVIALHDALTENRADEFQSPERKEASLAAHRAIVEAVKGGQGMQAERAMRDHLEEVERIMFSNDK